MEPFETNFLGGKSYCAEIEWARKNCCLHPDHDYVNAKLYLGALGFGSALRLLEKIRRKQGAKHTCKVCKCCGNRYSTN